nr:immunoglobulin light chain junction region [Macaca mulatta]
CLLYFNGGTRVF